MTRLVTISKNNCPQVCKSISYNFTGFMLYFYTDICLILSLISKRNLKRFFTLLLLLAFWFYRQNEDIQYSIYSIYSIYIIYSIYSIYSIVCLIQYTLYSKHTGDTLGYRNHRSLYSYLLSIYCYVSTGTLLIDSFGSPDTLSMHRYSCHFSSSYYFAPVFR